MGELGERAVETDCLARVVVDGGLEEDAVLGSVAATLLAGATLGVARSRRWI
jgi:hypothetical protein